MAVIAVGQNLGPYRIVEKLGQGGMADVYKAYQPSLDRYVAMKILPPILARETEFQERFRREAQVIAHLTHPYILQVYDADTKDDVSYIVMQYVAGGTLKSRLGASLPLDFALRMVQQIGSALDYAHRRGVIHRDVKPANVLMEEGDWPLLSDFGIARLVEASARITKTGVGVGTPEYMAPEQGLGQPVDGRADLYALGIMLYEMLVGRVPFLADTPLAVVLKHINEPLPMPRALNAALPDCVQRVVLKALAKAPEDRFDTASEMAATLESAIHEAQAQEATSIVFVAPERPGAEAAVAPKRVLSRDEPAPGKPGKEASPEGDRWAPPTPEAPAPARASRWPGRRLAALGAVLLVVVAVLFAGSRLFSGRPESPPLAEAGISSPPAPTQDAVSGAIARSSQLLSEGDATGAVVALQAVADQAKESPVFNDAMYRARIELAKSLVAKGDYSGAAEQFAGIEAMRTGDVEAARQRDLAQGYVAAERARGSDWLAAVEAFEKVYETDPAYGQVRGELYGSLVQLARSLQGRGEAEEASRYLERATQVNPEGQEARALLEALAVEAEPPAAPPVATPIPPPAPTRVPTPVRAQPTVVPVAPSPVPPAPTATKAPFELPPGAGGPAPTPTKPPFSPF